MHQKDTEWFAFLYLCGERDRDLLLGKVKMKFSDLDRLFYLTDFLDLPKVNQEIWNRYGAQFQEQFYQLEKIGDETLCLASWDPSEVDADLHEKWVQEFCSQIPNEDSKKRLKLYVCRKYKQNGWDD